MKLYFKNLLSFVVIALSLHARELPKQFSIDKELPEWVETVEAQMNKENPEERNSDGVYYFSATYRPTLKKKPSIDTTRCA